MNYGIIKIEELSKLDFSELNQTSAAQNSRAAGFALDVAEFELQQLPKASYNSNSI